MSVVSVLLVEHDAPTALRVREALDDSTGFSICAEKATAVAAIASAVQNHPGLCLIDINIPGGGMAAAWEVSSRLPQAKIVMLTDSEVIPGLVLALAAGVSGFVRTDIGLERLPKVLESVMAGEVAIPRASVREIAARFRHGRARKRTIVVDAQPSRRHGDDDRAEPGSGRQLRRRYAPEFRHRRKTA